MHWLAGVARRLVQAQILHPWTVVLVVMASLVPCALLSSRLEIRSSFDALLPSDMESAVEQRRLDARMGGAGTLVVVIEGDGLGRQRQLIDVLSARINELGPAYVRGVDDGMRHLRRLMDRYWYVYASERDLLALGDDLSEARDGAIMKRAGLDLGLDDGEPEDDPWTLESIRDRLRPPAPQGLERSMPDYYLSDDGALGAIVVRTAFGSGDSRLAELTSKIRTISAQAQRDLGVSGFSVGFTGSAVARPEEHRAVVRDLTHVGLLGVGLVLGIVFLYFLRVRALVALTLAIATGCAWSLALAVLAVGHVNSASGFLLSIVAGNGINFGIIYMARFMEARTDEGLPIADAIRRTHEQTWAATLTASAAASVAYGSLAVTTLPAFRDFGIIGGGGLLLCWAATYALLPAVLVISERHWPTQSGVADWRGRVRRLFAGPMFDAARRFPRAIAVAACCVVAASAIATVRFIVTDPTEYDLRNIRNDAADPGSARALAKRVAPLVGPLSRDGRAMVADRPEQVPPLVAELRRRRAASQPGAVPFERVVSILDLVPKDQQARIAAARKVAEVVQYARRKKLISDEAWDELGPRVTDLHAVAAQDLPDSIAWRFDEADGTRGRVVYVEPTAGRSLNDARYLKLLADSFRRVPLPDGSVVRGSGDPVVFADLLEGIQHEEPKAILASLLGTVVVILGAFRARAAGWLSLGCVVAGICVLTGILYALGLKLNFLSFMALPITVGVGADYAVNVLRRRELASFRTAAPAFVQTGGAVVLCSLTTILGYAALLGSVNGAVRSFGLAAALGEIIMILVATLLLPSVLLDMEGRKARIPPAP